MNNIILNTVIQDFINTNLDADISKLLFKNSKINGVSVKDIVIQIEAKKRCKNKLPTWYSKNNIYYPNKLNIEQTSSEITAEYKSRLVSGNSLIDLTGGFGVDAYYFSKRIKKVIHSEINSELSEIAQHNYKTLGVSNILCMASDGMAYITKVKTRFDWIYVDPSRRHERKGKVFALKDCLPNIPEHLNTLFEHSDRILIKTSPLLDIKAGLSELKYTKEIHVLAVNNEVKELLWILEKGFLEAVNVQTVNIKKESTQELSFKLDNEFKAIATFSEPLTYLYEPNAAILKSGAFKLVSEQLKVNKLSNNTHLYTSDSLLEFPGRRFTIEKECPFHKKELKKHLKNIKANISVRNFPESAERLKKMFQMSDGGDTYIFFTTKQDRQKTVLFCLKV